MATLIKCLNCGNNVSSEAYRCPKCGKDPKAQILKCSLCGTSFAYDDRSRDCPNCGHHVVTEYVEKGICPKCGNTTWEARTRTERQFRGDLGYEKRTYTDYYCKKCNYETYEKPGSAQAEASALVDQGITAYNAKDYAKAVELFQKAADMGNGEAMKNLGVCYNTGNGVPKDMTKAAEWYEKAANQGNAQAMFNLGNMYKNGNDVPKDINKAAEWYEKGANNGHAGAMCNIGYAYDVGQGVTQDKTKAAYWYQKAAENGSPMGMSNFGEYFRDGLGGIKQDFAQAEQWFNKAIAAGCEAAKAELAKLKQMRGY